MAMIYLWRFKPDETKGFPEEVIHHNARFIAGHAIITPTDLEPRLAHPAFPSLPALYETIPHWVIKSDLGRLLMVYLDGGIYADADCFIEKTFMDANVILFTEKTCASVDDLGPKECKHPDHVVRVANYCFGAAMPRHPFLKQVIDECLHRLSLLAANPSPDHEDILWVCGPDVITTVYHATKHQYPDVFLHDTSFVNHHCHGSWR